MSALRKAPPTVTLDPLAAKLTALGPDYPASCLPELVDQATRDELSPTSFLDLVLGAELERKDERRVTTMLKLSGLPPGRPWRTSTGASSRGWTGGRSRRWRPAATSGRRPTSCSSGPRVWEKVILATALGVKAIKNGFSVTHFVLDELMHALRADAAMPPARLRAKRYFNSALLIIDEVGIRPLDRVEANLFVRLVSARYERGSIMLTSNKHVRDWPAIFADDEILTTAILDRLLHHVQVVHIDGRSYRLRELGALLGPRPEERAAPSTLSAGGEPR